MSFDRLPSLEAQPTTSRSTGYSDDPEFAKLSTELSSRLFTLTSNLTQLNRQLALVGTKKDSETVRDRVKRLIEQTRNDFKTVSEGVKRVQNWPDVSPQMKFTQKKLGDQYLSSLQDFQAAQRLSAEKTRQYVSAAKRALHTDGDADANYTDNDGGEGGQQQQVPLVLQQAALADQGEVDFQESLIIQREGEIREIEQGILEVNDIFRNLSTLVNEQGESLDMIEANVGNVAQDHKAAAGELTQAAKYQKSARSRACCLLLILSVVLTVILLAIFLG